MSQTHQQFLESMSTMDQLLDHPIDECGNCMYRFLMAEVARDMLKGEFPADSIGPWTEDAIGIWDDEFKRRWHETKYMKLYLERINAGDGRIQALKAIKDKGWEP
jgi:hypothetical protein